MPDEYARWLRELRKTGERRELIRIMRRGKKMDKLEGYVVGVSAAIVLLHLLDPNMYLNGYCAIPIALVKWFRVLDDDEQFAGTALMLRGIEPVAPEGIDIGSWQSLFNSVHPRFPLTTVHIERRRPGVCYIGRGVAVKRRSVEMVTISPAARWSRDTDKYRYDDLTRVDFGGGYEEALAIVNEWRAEQQID